jgi:hypothetical protein
MSSNSIDVNTLGNIIKWKPGAFKCKPAAWASRLSFFEIVLYEIATLRKDIYINSQKRNLIQTLIGIKSAHTCN